ncbi:hypothetical protein BDW75DRAFT_54510 [Aspergillus navahoensis]
MSLWGRCEGTEMLRKSDRWAKTQGAKICMLVLGGEDYLYKGVATLSLWGETAAHARACLSPESARMRGAPSNQGRILHDGVKPSQAFLACKLEFLQPCRSCVAWETRWARKLSSGTSLGRKAMVGQLGPHLLEPCAAGPAWD